MTDKQKTVVQTAHQYLTIVLLPVLTILFSFATWFVSETYEMVKYDHDKRIQETQRSQQKDDEHDRNFQRVDLSIADINNRLNHGNSDR